MLTQEAKAIRYLDHLLFQHAGEIGYISFGIGKFITERYAIAGLYGVVPKPIADSRFIETFTFKQTYNFLKSEKIDLYSGVNVSHVPDIRYQTSRGGEAPKSYYPIGSVRGLIYGGAAVYIGPSRKAVFYIESGINDIWIVNWYSNKEEVRLSDQVSLAIGFRYHFN